jgi:hypothetical protein
LQTLAVLLAAELAGIGRRAAIDAHPAPLASLLPLMALAAASSTAEELAQIEALSERIA